MFISLTPLTQPFVLSILQRRHLHFFFNYLFNRLICENERLRGEMIELESEMIGARLDNVYLDKELAGRIQQIQLLLAANTPADVKEKMWSQIESEMCLQRSKTIAQMCRTKQVREDLKNRNNISMVRR